MNNHETACALLPEVHIATAKKDGQFYAIEFEDGLVTQGKGRKNSLVMAADLRAVNDDRHPSSYTAKWLPGDRIIVVACARTKKRPKPPPNYGGHGACRKNYWLRLNQIS